MRHRVFGNHLGRPKKQTKALIRGLILAVLERGQIKTTLAKARTIGKDLEKVISLSRQDLLGHRRRVEKILGTAAVLHRLFGQIGPAFADVPSGFVRLTKIGPRQSDGAEMAIVELVRRPVEVAIVPSNQTKVASGGTIEKDKEPGKINPARKDSKSPKSKQDKVNKLRKGKNA